MAEEGVFCNNADVKRHAGAGASATSSAEGYTNQFIGQAESYINVLTQINFSDAFASLNSDTKEILREAAARLSAIDVISYDLLGYSSAREAENIININWHRFIQCVKLLSNHSKAKWLEEQT